MMVDLNDMSGLRVLAALKRAGSDELAAQMVQFISPGETQAVAHYFNDPTGNPLSGEASKIAAEVEATLDSLHNDTSR